MKKFKYPLAIEGPPHELLRIADRLMNEIGYEWAAYSKKDYREYPILSTFYTYYQPGLGFVIDEFIKSDTVPKDSIRIDHKQEELIIALAAMVDDDEFYAGEWSVFIDDTTDPCYTVGNLYKIKSDEYLSGLHRRVIHFADDRGLENGWLASSFRKATKEEIINHFKKQDMLFGKKDQTKITVDVDFVKSAHKEACAEWKAKIEKEFPDLFPRVELSEKARKFYGPHMSESMNNMIKFVDQSYAHTMLKVGNNHRDISINIMNLIAEKWGD